MALEFTCMYLDLGYKRNITNKEHFQIGIEARRIIGKGQSV